MALMARQATGSANPSISIRCAGQAREKCLPLHISIAIGALLAFITTKDQICFLHDVFIDNEMKMLKNTTLHNQAETQGSSNVFFFPLP